MNELSAADTRRAVELLARLYDDRNRVDGGIRIPRTFPKDELAWLKKIGLAPNQRVVVTHDQAIKAISTAKALYTIRTGAKAFIASLEGPGRPHGVFLEAALLAHRLPVHPFHVQGSHCRVCGLERKQIVDSTERFHDWHALGTGIPGDLLWALVGIEELERWCRTPAPKEGKARLLAILRAIDALPDSARAGAAVAAVRELALFGADRQGYIARSVVETLAFAGVLEAPPYFGLANNFVSFWERDRRPTVRTEFDAPLGFWTGKHGVNWSNVERLFGLTRKDALNVDQASIARRKGGPRIKAPNRPETAKRLTRRPAQAGDVWAVRVREDCYVLVYVWEVEGGARPYARVEYLDWVGAEPPPAGVTDGLDGMKVRGRGRQRWQMRAHGFEKTTGAVLVAAKVAPPRDKRPVPRPPMGAARELAELARWCFGELDRM